MELILRPMAEIDIADSVAWYEERSASLGKKFGQATAKVLNLLKKNPKAFEVRARKTGYEIRAANLHRFPFLVYYHIDLGRDAVIVEAIWHTARKPAQWKKRIR